MAVFPSFTVKQPISLEFIVQTVNEFFPSEHDRVTCIQFWPKFATLAKYWFNVLRWTKVEQRD